MWSGLRIGPSKITSPARTPFCRTHVLLFRRHVQLGFEPQRRAERRLVHGPLFFCEGRLALLLFFFFGEARGIVDGVYPMDNLFFLGGLDLAGIARHPDHCGADPKRAVNYQHLLLLQSNTIDSLELDGYSFEAELVPLAEVVKGQTAIHTLSAIRAR
jgi:hypothetical protein